MESPTKKTCYEHVHTSMSSSPTRDPPNQAPRSQVQMHASVQQPSNPPTYDEQLKALLCRFFIEELNKASDTPANKKARSGIRGQIGLTLHEAIHGVAPEKIPDWWTFDQSCKRDVMAPADFEAWVHKRESQALDMALKRLELIWKDHEIREAAAEKRRQERTDMLKRQKYENTAREQQMFMVREQQKKRAIIQRQKQEGARKLKQQEHQNTVRLQNHQTAIILDQNRRKRKFEVFSEIQKCALGTTAQQEIQIPGSNVQNQLTARSNKQTSTQHSKIAFQREKIQYPSTTEQQKQYTANPLGMQYQMQQQQHRAVNVGQTTLGYRHFQGQHQIASSVGLNPHAGRGSGSQQGLQPQKQHTVNVGPEQQQANGLQSQQKYSSTIDPSLIRAGNVYEQNQLVIIQKQNQPKAMNADLERKKYAKIRELQKRYALDATARASVRSTVPHQQHLETPLLPNGEAVFLRSIQESLYAFRRGTAYGT